MNLQKTKLMSSHNIQVTLNQQYPQMVEEYLYWGHTMKLGRVNQITEITRRVSIASAVFGNLRRLLGRSTIPINLE